jgi:hypothetical protein
MNSGSNSNRVPSVPLVTAHLPSSIGYNPGYFYAPLAPLAPPRLYPLYPLTTLHSPHHYPSTYLALHPTSLKEPNSHPTDYQLFTPLITLLQHDPVQKSQD